MLNRRELIESVAGPAAALAAVGFDLSRARAVAAELAAHPGTAAETAADERFWFQVQQAFTADRSLINLNNGGVSPSPAIVQDAMKRYLDYSNLAPVRTMWQDLEPQKENVRTALARVFGCDREEIAITRNTSEGLQACQFGFDLARGDEVLTTTQDYPRMITTFKQRERRDGIVMRQFSIPTPCEDDARIVALFEENVTPRTRLILVSHIVFLTGQVLPVARVVELGRRRGIPVLVDGAHAFAHLVFSNADLGCDYYATSLHKWLAAPHGTGLLYVRKEKIPGVWPLMAAPEEMSADIRKFEEIGTHPAANFLAISEALAFHLGIGPERKEARLRYLRDRWAARLARLERIRLHTSLKPPFACALATVQIDGVDSGKLAEHLWSRHRIIVAAIKHAEFEGVRVAPSVYTMPQEVDRFADVMEEIARKGLPS
ncbi:MAG: aminotransferase class V-fold PLP-dependent enzyme [Acidobacteriota bacterium]